MEPGSLGGTPLSAVIKRGDCESLRDTVVESVGERDVFLGEGGEKDPGSWGVEGARPTRARRSRGRGDNSRLALPPRIHCARENAGIDATIRLHRPKRARGSKRSSSRLI